MKLSFKLKTLLLAIALFAGATAFVAKRLHDIHSFKLAVAELRTAGCVISFNSESQNPDSMRCRIPQCYEADLSFTQDQEKVEQILSNGQQLRRIVLDCRSFDIAKLNDIIPTFPLLDIVVLVNAETFPETVWKLTYDFPRINFRLSRYADVKKTQNDCYWGYYTNGKRIGDNDSFWKSWHLAVEEDDWQISRSHFAYDSGSQRTMRAISSD